MELWHAWTCPYCMRVRIALAEKGLAYEDHEIDLGHKPPELLALNPAGGVPVLVDHGRAIPDSMAILRYVEERFPDPPLFPANADARARAQELYERVTRLLGPQLPRLARGSDAEKTQAATAVREALAALERDAPDDGFLVGAFTIADVALASLTAKLPEALRPSALFLPRLARWEAAVRARPAVASSIAAKRPA